MSQNSDVTASAVSRLERGLAMPSTDFLFRWATAIHDGRPAPETWTTAVYAAAVAFPDESQFMLVRFADADHDPDVMWSLATQIAALQSAYPEGLEPSWSAVAATRYPRFSITRSDGDAATAVWFDVLRRADRTTAAAVIRRMARMDPSSELMAWITFALGQLGAQKPMEVSPPTEAAPGDVADPLWSECAARWVDLTPLARETLVSLSRQLRREHSE